MDQKHHIFIKFLLHLSIVNLSYGLPSKLGNFLTERDIFIFKSGCSTIKSSHTRKLAKMIWTPSPYICLQELFICLLFSFYEESYIFLSRSVICRGHQNIYRISKKFNSLLIFNFLLRKIKAIAAGSQGSFFQVTLR